MAIGDDGAVEYSGDLPDREKPVFTGKSQRRLHDRPIPQLLRFLKIDPVLFAIAFAFGRVASPCRKNIEKQYRLSSSACILFRAGEGAIVEELSTVKCSRYSRWIFSW